MTHQLALHLRRDASMQGASMEHRGIMMIELNVKSATAMSHAMDLSVRMEHLVKWSLTRLGENPYTRRFAKMILEFVQRLIAMSLPSVMKSVPLMGTVLVNKNVVITDVESLACNRPKILEWLIMMKIPLPL